MEVKGVVSDWGELKVKIPPSAYFQVVKLEDNLRGNTDSQGFAAFISEFPKIKVRADGSFRVDLKDVPSGKYFIALQRAVPREMYGEDKGSAIPILVTKKGSPLLIEVPGSFPLDVGRVDVAVRPSKAPVASGTK
ncbi:MAG: hypothetical protein P8X65_00490 [Syntrophobacterales bacterium]